MAGDLSHVWQPLDIGPLHVKNRIVVPARTVLWATDQHTLSDRHIAHYAELAEGGAALIVTEQHGAHSTSTGSFHRPCTAWDKRAIPGFAAFAEAVHPHDVKAVVQLFAPGVHDKGTMIVDDWRPLWGVSHRPSIVHGETPLQMGVDEIRELVRGHGQSAVNVRAGGLDGVEIHAAHGYLAGQFLSPAYNSRSDAYGGSVHNRCRFVTEIGREVRERVGGDIALGVRLSYDEFLGPAGITPDDADEQVAHLASTGLFDYFSISGGSYHTIHLVSAPMSMDDGHLLPLARRAKGVIGDRAPVFAVGRVRDLGLAEAALNSGAADMVALGRASFADPHIVRKTREGREREIIKCTGVNECIGRLFDNREVICMMNPATGRERRWGSGTLARLRAADRRRVAVVGGGPAGMKTAEVAARRGHDVVLFEREAELGGQFNLISRFPARAGYEDAAENLRRALDNAGVQVRVATTADAGSLAADEPDVVVVATGARYDMSGFSPFRPDRPGIPGADQEHVTNLKTAAERALADVRSLGDNVVIVDESGAYLPLALAELLAGAGVRVEVVSPHMFIGQATQRHLDLFAIYPRLKQVGVELSPQKAVGEIDGARVLIDDLWGGAQRVSDGVSTVVLSGFRLPEDELFAQIRDHFADVRRVGDCVAPRTPAAVIYDGEKLGREL